LSGWLGQPHLGGDAQTYLGQYGGFGWRPGGSLELGVDFTQFALSASLDYGNTYFVEDQASHVTAASLMADWAPVKLAFGGWRPLIPRTSGSRQNGSWLPGSAARPAG
jgi:hypothetical protein